MKIYAKIPDVQYRPAFAPQARAMPPGDLRRKALAPPCPIRAAPQGPEMPVRPAPLAPGQRFEGPTLVTLCGRAGPAPLSPTASELFCADDSFRTPLHLAAAGPGGAELVRALLERCPRNRRHELGSQISLIPDGRSLGSPGVAALVYNEDPEDVVGILVALGAVGIVPAELAAEAMSLGVQCDEPVRTWDAYASLVHRAQEGINEARARHIMPLQNSSEDVAGIEESNVFEIIRHGTRAQLQEKVRRNPNLLLHPDRTSHGRNLPLAVALTAKRPDTALFLLKAMEAYRLLEEHPLDTPNADGDTPLTLAIKFGETAVVRALLQMGASLRMMADHPTGGPIKRGSPFFRRPEMVPPTPFEIAIVNGQAAVLDVLLQAQETSLETQPGQPLAKLADLVATHPQRDTALALARVLENANQRRCRPPSK